MRSSVIIVLALVVLAAAAPNPNLKNGRVTEVKSLPGWPSGKPLPARTYSGFLDLQDSKEPGTDEMFMHYVLYESENDPANDPVIVWYNGGPGATSVWGLFVENGPLLLNAESLVGTNGSATDIQLVENPFAWTKFASLVAFGNPPPIGFSYCNPPGPKGNGFACGGWNDTRVGAANAEAINILFNDHFPQLLFNKPEKELYIIGESYAGVYIGELGAQMVANPTRFNKVLAHLSGIALGDACLGSDVLCGGRGPWWELMFLYGHAQFPTTLWEKLLSVCGGETELKKNIPASKRPAACQSTLKEVNTAVGGYFVYNLYDQCPHNAFMTAGDGSLGPMSKKQPFAHQRRDTSKATAASLLAARKRLRTNPAVRRSAQAQEVEVVPNVQFPLMNGYWCPEQVLFDYFNRDDVRVAMGVPVDSNFFNADDGRGMNYTYNSKTVMPFIASLIQNTSTIGRPVRVIAYDGDADASINVFVTQDVWTGFADTQKYTKTSAWRPWTVGENIVGGYVTEWQNGLLKYVTMRGSGHMVPEFKPLPAMTFVENFVRNEKLPAWNPSGPPNDQSTFLGSRAGKP